MTPAYFVTHQEFSERNIGLSVGESSTTPLEGNKDKGLVEEAKQLLQHMVPQQVCIAT